MEVAIAVRSVEGTVGHPCLWEGLGRGRVQGWGLGVVGEACVGGGGIRDTAAARVGLHYTGTKYICRASPLCGCGGDGLVQLAA